MTRDRCKSCGAEITFAVTVAGKVAPFDAVPTDDGTFYLLMRFGKLEAAHIDERSADVAVAEGRRSPRFKSHFATCPNAANHRKPREPT